VYPALAVRQSLSAEHDLLWVGGEGGMEENLVKRTGLSFKAIPAAGLHGVGLKALPRNLAQITRGIFAARRILKEFEPDVMLFTGGYVAFPMALAGIKIPSLLYVPDIEPGLALKAIARFADVITVTAADSRKYFSPRARLVETGYPTRADLTKWKRADARAHFNLDEDLPVLLVFGGSKGARSINNALLAHLPALLAHAQIIHISGELDWPAVQVAQAALNAEQRTRYHAYPYLHEEMGAALAAADLAVSRAGASALGEYPLFGLPAILVPYPYAWRYQKVNADYLVQNGAALLLEDVRLKADLAETVLSVLHDRARLAAMRIAMRALARPDAAHRIAAELQQLAARG
jgi:UDP-N-acetylglucosamine--N-acetylmuramyl-(pentapeptide) pyrophosphoryl-undecaprenol N-acetylglucosamine transferase